MTRGTKKEQTLTPLELKIMQALWRSGGGTVAEVQELLDEELAYTTVQTMLNVLLRKGKAKRRAVGRAFRYTPALSREAAVGGALRDMVKRMFGGSSEALLMALVDTQQISEKDLRRAALRLNEAEKEQHDKADL